MKKNYAKTSHRFQRFLFLPTNSITYFKIRKKYGKVSHKIKKKKLNITIYYIYEQIRCK